MNKNILQWPNLKLKNKSSDITADDNYLKIVKDLKDTLTVKQGLGLAAPQIGYFKRVLIINLSQYDVNPFGKDWVTIINPFIKLYGEKISWNEACLSVRWTGEKVERFSKCDVEYLDEELNPCSISLTWPISGIVQHEYDHLDGVLYVDRISSFKRRRIRRKIEKKVKLEMREKRRNERLRRKEYE